MTTPGALHETARRWLAQSRAAVEVSVVRTRGSVPREVGTRMLVSADEVVGTIGGGRLEMSAIADARALLASAGAGPLERRYPLGPALGQCCGGTVSLRAQRLSAQSLSEWPRAEPLFTLQLYGAGHVGRAIAGLLESLDCRVQWIDEREGEFPASAGATHIERVCVEPVQAEVALAPAGAFYLVLTHSHDLDFAITEAILKRGDFGYLGLIGSATKRSRFERRLAQRGFDGHVLDRVSCPIGVEGIDRKEPEAIAVAVVAQLLQRACARARPVAPSQSG